MTDEEQPEPECPFGITWEDVKAFLPQDVHLIYIDYQDNLDNSMDRIEACIQQQDWSPIDEVVDDWMFEQSGYSMDCIYGELKTELQDNFDIDEDQADEVIEEYRDSIDEELYSRDDSTPISDLLRNTTDIVFLYDMVLDVGYDPDDGDDILEPLRELREALQINGRHFDADLTKLLFETNGGSVYVAFSSNCIKTEDLFYIGDNNVIEFKHPHIAIANAYSEATYEVQLYGHTMQLALDPKRISVDNANKYSLTDNLPYSAKWDWPSDTKVKLLEVDYLQIMLDIRQAYRERCGLETANVAGY